MKYLMEQNELRITGYKPMWFDSFYVSLLSSKYKNAARGKEGKTNWVPATWIGFVSNLKALGRTRKCSSVIYVIGK
jgi:hypothetical protein